MRHSYFEGWYFKQRGADGTVAFIVARHRDGSGNDAASLQIITDDGAHHIPFAASEAEFYTNEPRVRLAKSAFTARGLKLDVRADGLRAEGALSFGKLIPPAGDIMGPFRFVPWMECRHAVASLLHTVDGAVMINGKRYAFEHGAGYIEGDRGASFPRRYIWTQGDWDGNSLMLSVADIPYHGLRFVGCVGFLYYRGHETRIATYRGARVLRAQNEGALVQQGNLTLEIEAAARREQALRAPMLGGMTRMIRESASCPVRCRCAIGKETLFDLVCERASYERNWTATTP